MLVLAPSAGDSMKGRNSMLKTLPVRPPKNAAKIFVATTPAAQDLGVAKRLWEVSAKLTRLTG